MKEGSVANTYPQLAVKGVGYDRLLGGLEIDVRLRDHLAKSFEVRCRFQLCLHTYLTFLPSPSLSPSLPLLSPHYPTQSMKKTQGSVFDSPRAMAKLLKEAKRVKQVLSANTEHFAQVHKCSTTTNVC